MADRHCRSLLGRQPILRCHIDWPLEICSLAQLQVIPHRRRGDGSSIRRMSLAYMLAFPKALSAPAWFIGRSRKLCLSDFTAGSWTCVEPNLCVSIDVAMKCWEERCRWWKFLSIRPTLGTFISLPPTKGIFCCNFGDWAIGASSKAGFVSATSAMGRLVDLPIWSANEQVFVERRIVTIFLVSFAAIPLYEPPTRPVAILGTRAAIQ